MPNNVVTQCTCVSVCVLTYKRRAGVCICSRSLARPSHSSARAGAMEREAWEPSAVEACERALAYVFYYVLFDRLALL